MPWWFLLLLLMATLALSSVALVAFRMGRRSEEMNGFGMVSSSPRSPESDVAAAALDRGVFSAALVAEGRIAWASAALGHLLGQEPPQLTGRAFAACFRNPAAGDAFLARARTSAPLLFPLRLEGELDRPDRGSVLVRMTLFPMDPKSPTAGLAWIVEEVAGASTSDAEARRLDPFLETVIETADIWINTLDPEARVVLWNQAAERISGYTKSEVQGSASIWKLLYPDPDYLAAVAARVGAILRENEVARDFQTTIRTKTGEQRIISWDSRALKDAQGNVTGSLAIGRDITEMKRTEEELARVHFIQNLILQHSSLGLAFVRNRTMEWVNPRLAEIAERTPAELVGRSTRLLYAEDATFETVGESGYPQLAKGGTAEFKVQVRLASGGARWCRFLGKALDPRHPHDGSIWVVEDIQSRIAAEEALAESEARFRAIFEGTQDALLLLTRSAIFDCNQRALEVFGFDQKSEFLGRHPVDLSSGLQPEDDAPAQAHWDRHLQTALLEGSVLFPWEFRTERHQAFRAEVMVSAFAMGTRKVFQASVRPLHRF